MALGGIALSCIAGAATSIGGGAVVWHRSFQPLTLALGMSAAAGVMTYLTFVEVFPEVHNVFVQAFGTAQFAEAQCLATALAGFTFFIGWSGAELIAYFLDKVLDAHHGPRNLKKASDVATEVSMQPLTTADRFVECGRCTPTRLDAVADHSQCRHVQPLDYEVVTTLAAEELFRQDQRRLTRTGWFTTLALCLHNVPEGVATFTSAAAGNKLGVSVAMAIGIHNIPEGVAVAVPVYFATRSRLKAFTIATATGKYSRGGQITVYMQGWPSPSAP